MNAILGGHVDLTDSNLTQKSKVEAGQLRFIAIANCVQCGVPIAFKVTHQHRRKSRPR